MTRGGLSEGLRAFVKHPGEGEAACVSDYSIFLDDADGSLFAVLRRSETHKTDALPEQEVMVAGGTSWPA